MISRPIGSTKNMDYITELAGREIGLSQRPTTTTERQDDEDPGVDYLLLVQFRTTKQACYSAIFWS